MIMIIHSGKISTKRITQFASSIGMIDLEVLMYRCGW